MGAGAGDARVAGAVAGRALARGDADIGMGVLLAGLSASAVRTTGRLLVGDEFIDSHDVCCLCCIVVGRAEYRAEYSRVEVEEEVEIELK